LEFFDRYQQAKKLKNSNSY